MPHPKDLVLRVKISLLRGFLSGISKLPWQLRAKLGFVGGYLFSLFPSRERSVAAAQLKRFLPDSQHPNLVRRVFASIGMQGMEALNLAPIIDHSDQLIQCNDWPYIQQLLDSKRGIVVLTAHVGNWDLVGAYFVAKGFDVSTVARPARDPAVHAVMAEMRNRYGIETIWRTSAASARKIAAALLKKRIVAALIDQDTDVASTFVPFFGFPAHTPSGMVELAQRTNSAVCSVFSRREPDGTFTIQVQPLPEDVDEYTVLAEFNRQLEDWIRHSPDQWVWFHKRWRTQEDYGRISHTEYLNFLLPPTR